MLRLNRVERELGADGSTLVHEILILGMTMEQISQRRGLRGQRWLDYFSRRFRECLDRLALIYGFATRSHRELVRKRAGRLAAALPARVMSGLANSEGRDETTHWI